MPIRFLVLAMSTLKVCYLCKAEREIDDFIRRIDDRYYGMCRPCVSGILKRRPNNKRLKLTHTDTHRTCYLCLRFLENTDFTRRKVGTYFSACKDCNKNVFGPRRRARKKGAPGSFTTSEWRTLVSQHEVCPGCHIRWDDITILSGKSSAVTADHKVPISRGGTNYIENIQPLCHSCNSAKGAKVPSFSIKEIGNFAQRVWCAETSYYQDWKPTNPAHGQCVVTAIKLSLLAGGEILRTIVRSGESHYCNYIDNKIVDLTACQFDFELDYSQAERVEMNHLLDAEFTEQRFRLFSALFDHLAYDEPTEP